LNILNSEININIGKSHMWPRHFLVESDPMTELGSSDWFLKCQKCDHHHQAFKHVSVQNRPFESVHLHSETFHSPKNVRGEFQTVREAWFEDQVNNCFRFGQWIITKLRSQLCKYSQLRWKNNAQNPWKAQMSQFQLFSIIFLWSHLSSHAERFIDFAIVQWPSQHSWDSCGDI
jgi:hypothetical protein